MMYKIINNLLSNAFKFTPQNGHIQLTVNKADRNDKEYIMIEVSDTGCGIDEKDLPHIFERFYQIKDDNAPAGSGIGLHLVKEYARLHNGDITVSTKLTSAVLLQCIYRLICLKAMIKIIRKKKKKRMK